MEQHLASQLSQANISTNWIIVRYVNVNYKHELIKIMLNMWVVFLCNISYDANICSRLERKILDRAFDSLISKLHSSLILYSTLRQYFKSGVKDDTTTELCISSPNVQVEYNMTMSRSQTIYISIGLQSMDTYSEKNKMNTEAYFTSKYIELILIFS